MHPDTYLRKFGREDSTHAVLRPQPRLVNERKPLSFRIKKKVRKAIKAITAR